MTSWFSPFYRRNESEKKPLKIRTSSSVCPVGVMVHSLRDLLHRAADKLKLSGRQHDLRVVLEEDGTEVDDEEYFRALPAQTTLVILQYGETWLPPRRLALDELLDALEERRSRQGIQEIVDEINSEVKPERLELLAKLLSSISGQGHLETKQQHSQWFSDLNKNFNKKDDYMRENARRRVRSYHRVADDYINKRVKYRHLKQDYKAVLAEFFKLLQHNDFYSDYFSRQSRLKHVKFCDDEGWFTCEGLYNEATCQHFHKINPYNNQHDRLLFSTWNLDHGIEKSREVLPSLLSAIDNLPNHSKLNWIYFYDLLFTRRNLKCVHVVCHDKSEHTSQKCDPHQFYSHR